MAEEDYSRNKYATYKGLPELAGVCSIRAALRPGLSVEECVGRLKRFHYAFKRMHEILTKRITADPIYELKMAYSYHAYLCTEHASALRGRVGEMREPPLGLDAVPDASLEIFFDEILASPGSKELITGLYGTAIPALQAGLERFLAETHLLADTPSARICRIAQMELREMAEFGQRALEALVDEASEREMVRAGRVFWKHV